MDGAKRYSAEELPLIIWSYHTTPHSTTQETPFWVAFGTNVVIPAETIEPSTGRILSDEGSNEPNLRVKLDLLDEH